MAQSFATDPALPSQFPSPEGLREALGDATSNAREIFVRLWMTDGVPTVFLGCPSAYEDIRGWLGSRLKVEPKDVSLVGSARAGYSLAPPPDYGRPFGRRSDLDFAVVSADLFSRVAFEFDCFANDHKQGIVTPRSEAEDRLWKANLIFGPRNIPLGFFDANKIPGWNRYPVVQQIGQSMWCLIKRLEVTPAVPRVRRASVRVYRDWSSLIAQVKLNLKHSLTAK